MELQLVKEAEESVLLLLKWLSSELPKMGPVEQQPTNADEAVELWWTLHQQTRENVDKQVLNYARRGETDKLARPDALMLLLRASSSVIVLREMLAGRAHAGGELPRQSQSSAGVIELVMGTLWESEQFVRDELRDLAERQFPTPDR